MDPQQRRPRVVAAVAGTAVLVGATLATLATVSAAGAPEAPSASHRSPTVVQVSGQLIPKNADGTRYEAMGKLIGTWTFPASETENIYVPDSGARAFVKGIEYFDGCVNLNDNATCEAWEPHGQFRSTYLAWTFRNRDKGFVDGGCTHMPTGGDEGFRGVRGFLQMKDVFALTAVGSTSIYQGEIILNAMPDEKEVGIPRASASRVAASGARAAASC